MKRPAKRAARPPLSAQTAPPADRRPSRYGRWRAATLAAVYVLVALHIAHWKIAGKTLAPLELNEVMYTLELGIVTAGFLFMLAACVATLLFGRFFCGWGCHILALEDLCAWLLKKLRIRPRPIRSRLLLLVPPLAMFYMFLWPQVSRVLESRPLPPPRIQSEAAGWASFVTTDFWRNLPDPTIALLTFGICGFAIVYVLGSRSFCAYGCPYGTVFRALDRMSPGRIIAVGDCRQCAACTAACPSDVIVHEELLRFGTVVNAACVKDLECVSACPNEAVKYGLGRPPLLRGWRAWRALRRLSDFAWGEDALMAVVFVATLATFRGLYDAVPFLMTLGLGAILSYLSVVAVRFVYRPDVRMNQLLLKRTGRVTRLGAVFLAGATVCFGFWAHSAFIRYHEFCGFRAAQRNAGTPPDPDSSQFANALEHLGLCRQWGLYVSPRLARELGLLLTARGEARANRSDLAGAASDFREAIRLRPDVAAIRYNHGVVLSALGDQIAALAEYRRAAHLDPADPDIQNNLGFVLVQQQQWDEAKTCFERALTVRPEHADAHFNLAGVLIHDGRLDQAMRHLETAAQHDTHYADIYEAMRSGREARP